MTSSGSERPQETPGPRDLRVSDAERDQVASELGAHFQDGRLDQAEFDERVAAALRARTQGHLGILLADLPRRAASPGESAMAEPAAGGPPRMRVPWPLLALVPLLIAGIVAGAAGGWHGPHGPHHWGGGPWPLLWLWWLIPIAVIAMRRRWAQANGGRGPWR